MACLIFVVSQFGSMRMQMCAQESTFTVVELNVENLFDTTHDTLKNDWEFLPESSHHWTRSRYWTKLRRIGKTILSCGMENVGHDGSEVLCLPDLVGLCEVENDTCIRDLTKRSLLRNARYEYVMTDSPDERGIDVALLYSPFSFKMLSWKALRVVPSQGMKPTRDILYVSGELLTGDTLHVFVLHAPSRAQGVRETNRFRLQVMKCMCMAIDSIRKVNGSVKILAMGDFNDGADAASLHYVYGYDMVNVSENTKGRHGACGTYRYQGEWGSLDHILVSRNLLPFVKDCRIHDAPFLLEEDEKYGGVKPRRNYLGPRYNDGYSDHLPLVLRLEWQK